MAQTLKPRPRSAVERFTPLKPVQDDAWSNIFKPPPNETAEEKRERLMFQQEAQRISREIDESILESKKLLEKKKKAVKVLLLGTLITNYSSDRSANVTFTTVRTSRVREIDNVEE
jgi:hypothetical protein